MIRLEEGDTSKLTEGYLGEWFLKENLPDGYYCVYRYGDTAHYALTVQLKDGQMQGLESRYTTQPGKVKYAEIARLDGQKHGQAVQYLGNYIKYSVNYTFGLLDGPCIINGSFGEKLRTGYYKSGFRDSIWTYYDSDWEIANDSSNYWLSKQYVYKNGIPFLVSAWDSSGKQMVENGKGVILIKDWFSTRYVNYSGGLKNGADLELKPNGDTIYCRFFRDNQLITKIQFRDLPITKDSASYEVIYRKGMPSIYASNCFLYSIESWCYATQSRTDTINTFDPDCSGIDYYEVVKLDSQQKDGEWLINFPTNIPAMEGNYSQGQKSGIWTWNYPNGRQKMWIDYAKNEWKHFDSTGKFASSMKLEYLSQLTGTLWCIDNFWNNIDSADFQISQDCEVGHGLSFMLDGNINYYPFGGGYQTIGRYYLLGDNLEIILYRNNLDQRYLFRILSSSEDEILVRHVEK